MAAVSRSIAVLIIFAGVVGCREPPPATDSRTERHKAIVHRWIGEGFNKGQLTVVDELFAEQVAINGQRVDRAAVKQSMSRHLRGFPDLHVTIEDVVADEDAVGVWYTVEGTHQGEFEGIPPTGKRVRWVGSDLVHFDERGRISDANFLSDLFGLLRQIGARTAAPSARR